MGLRKSIQRVRKALATAESVQTPSGPMLLVTPGLVRVTIDMLHGLEKIIRIADQVEVEGSKIPEPEDWLDDGDGT